MNLSKVKLRRAAARGLSVTLSATTTLWLVGSSVFLAVPAAHASNDAVVSDITTTNPRIAPNGESELAVLGVNIQMDANPGGVDKRLQSVAVQLKSDDAPGAGEAALANVEVGRIYADSGLSGTGGQFDSNDALVATSTRLEAGATTVALTAPVNDSAALVSTADGAANNFFCVLDSVNQDAQILLGDVVAITDNSTGLVYNRIVTALDDANGATCGGAANDQVTLDTALPLDLGLDVLDTLNDLANFPAGITALLFTDVAANIVNGDTVKVGVGAVAEVRAVAGAIANLSGTDDMFTIAVATTFVHAAAEAVREVNEVVANISNSGASGFSAYAAPGTGALRTGYETAVIFGDTVADADADILTFTPPTTDTGNDAGNDLFFTFLTAGGAANQTFIAAIWPDEVAAEFVRIQLHDILLDNAGGGGGIAVNSNTTNNESKTVTMGSDNVAPTISKVEMFDNDADGNVDRAEVVFNESMGNTVTLTGNFVTVNGTAVVGNVNAIASVPASNDDLDLNVNGTWVTRTLLNDTLRIDAQGDGQSANCAVAENDPVGTYCNATASTGDTFSVVYDQGNATVAADDLVDSTGTVLADATVSSTDKARPVIMTAAQALPGTFQVRDNDGDSKVDELRVTGSESWGAASTVSGVELRRTDVNPNVVYTLSGVNGFVQSAGTAAGGGNVVTSNANDTIRLAVTESSGADVTGVFQLNYTAASTLVDAAGNEARSATGLAAVSGIVPVVSQAWITDIGADLDGAADADGQIDTLIVIFNSAVETDVTVGGAFTADMALSGGYAFVADGAWAGLILAENQDNDQLVTFSIVQSGAADSDLTPDWTYTNDGAADGGALCASPAVVNNACANVNDVLVESVVSSTATEANRAGPVLLAAPNGVVLYETTANDIWENGETLVFTFSEPVLASSFRTSYTNDALLNGPSDLGWVIGGGANAMPNSVTVGVTGRVVTITATESATAALTAADTVMMGANEIYDLQGNAAPGPATGGGVIPGFGVAVEQSLAAATALTVTPAAAPPVLRITTNDENSNGILDSFIVEFGGLISPTSIVATEFAAARGANFAVNTLGTGAPFCAGGAAGDNFACAAQNVTPDLAITSVATVSGGNDSRLLVSYDEAAEDTGARPQLKYVQATLADLAGNKIATFNAAAGNNTLLDLTIAAGAGDIPVRDGVAPMLLLKLLRDRDLDGKMDQFLGIFSETMLNGAGTLVNGVLASNGFSVAGKTLAANGLIGNNLNFQNLTFALVNAQFTVDVTEGASADTSLPAVTYTASGQHRDAGGHILANVAAGGETSDFGLEPEGPTINDGDLVRMTGDFKVYIVKFVGDKVFIRHIIDSHIVGFYGHLNLNNVIEVSTLDGTTLSAWVRAAGDTKVYEVNGDETKHWLTCADDSVAGQDCANEWTAAGGDPDGIYTVNSAEFGHYVTSVDVILPDQPN